jgi:hypothetical protein
MKRCFHVLLYVAFLSVWIIGMFAVCRWALMALGVPEGSL